MSFFDFLEKMLIKSVLYVLGRLIDPHGQSLSGIRREAFPKSVFRIKD